MVENNSSEDMFAGNIETNLSLSDQQDVQSVILEVVEPADEVAEAVDESNLVIIYQRAISSTSKLSLNAQRLLRTIISLVNNGGRPGKTTYTFTCADFAKIYDFKSDPSKQILRAGSELRETFILFDPDDPTKKNGIVTGWIDFLRVRGGMVTIRFESKLYNLYKTLQSYSYSIGNTREFESQYSFSLYEKFIVMLKDLQETSFYLSLDELWDLLNLKGKYLKSDGSYHYSSFKRRVLLPVLHDINGDGISGYPCNINFKFTEHVINRKVMGLNFIVWTVHTENAEVKIQNTFYESLSPDGKVYFDAALEMGFDPIDVERCIKEYQERGFIQIMQWISKNKNKGLGYCYACLYSGWYSAGSNGKFSFADPKKVEPFANAIYSDCSLFLENVDVSCLHYILDAIDIQFSNLKPQLHEFLSRNSFENFSKNKGFMLLLYEEFIGIITQKTDAAICGWYAEFIKSGGKEAVENMKLADQVPVLASSGQGRDGIISILRREGIVDKKIVDDILKYEDDYIQENIDYCVANYRVKKGQNNIGGAIIKACQNDYAGYVKKKAARLAAESEREKLLKDAEESRLIQNFGEMKHDLTDVDLTDFLQNCEEGTGLYEAVRAEIAEREKNKAMVSAEKYFFSLPDAVQNCIVETVKRNSSFFAKFVENKTYREIFASSFLRKLICNAIVEYREQEAEKAGN